MSSKSEIRLFNIIKKVRNCSFRGGQRRTYRTGGNRILPSEVGRRSRRNPFPSRRTCSGSERSIQILEIINRAKQEKQNRIVDFSPLGLWFHSMAAEEANHCQVSRRKWGVVPKKSRAMRSCERKRERETENSKNRGIDKSNGGRRSEGRLSLQEDN